MIFGKSRASEKANEQVIEIEAILGAIHKSQAVIEFQLDGTIIRANENFSKVMGIRPLRLKAESTACSRRLNMRRAKSTGRSGER